MFVGMLDVVFVCGGNSVVLLVVWWYRMMLIGVIDENGCVREE